MVYMIKVIAGRCAMHHAFTCNWCSYRSQVTLGEPPATVEPKIAWRAALKSSPLRTSLDSLSNSASRSSKRMSEWGSEWVSEERNKERVSVNVNRQEKHGYLLDCSDAQQSALFVPMVSVLLMMKTQQHTLQYKHPLVHWPPQFATSSPHSPNCLDDPIR